jgi:hypothetical protein
MADFHRKFRLPWVFLALQLACERQELRQEFVEEG